MNNLKRYVLTKDRKIIDTNDKTFKHNYTLKNGVSEYSIKIPNETFTHYGLGGVEWENHTYEFRNVDIKAQSDDALDLIEDGDLVLYCGRIKDVVKNKHLFCENDYCYIPVYFVKKCITAIYKPNSRGDYIKVWEAKK